MNKKYLSLVLSILLIGILVFSSSIAFASDECAGPKVDPESVGYQNNQPSNTPLGAPDPRPSELDAPDDCVLKAFKIDLDEERLQDGTFKVGDDDTASTDTNSKFEVTITNNNTTFGFTANMPVLHVYVKGGWDGGNLYSYYDEYEEGVYSDCGLHQSDNPKGKTGEGWSHIVFYYCEKIQLVEESAWAHYSAGAKPFTTIEGFNSNNWGWTNGPLTQRQEKYEFILWAAAGQNDFNKGINVGKVYVEYYNDKVSVTYAMSPGYTLEESHVWVGKGLLPTDRRGRYTNAPGQLYIESETFEGPIYVAFHAVVGIPVVD